VSFWRRASFAAKSWAISGFTVSIASISLPGRGATDWRLNL
jgi:hypothetical protein